MDTSGLPRVHAFASELGWFAIASHREVVMRLSFGRRTPRAAISSLELSVDPVATTSKFEQRMVNRLKAFAAGEPDDFLDVTLDVAGMTPFQRRVLSHCRKIRFGQIITYAGLAAKAGSPNAARAVGNVMRSNRFPLIVPCHRVVGAGGSLGGYSAPSGLDMKRRLLAREGSLEKLKC